MQLPSPYGPDRSLFLAAGILFGGVLLCAGGAYVLLSFGPAGPPSVSETSVRASRPGPAGSEAPQRRAPMPHQPGVQGPTLSQQPPPSAGVPSAPLMRSIPEPDLSVAGPAESGPVLARPKSSLGTPGGTSGNPAPPAPSPGATEGRVSIPSGSPVLEDASGRAEVQRLGRQAQALSGAIARLDRSREASTSSSSPKNSAGASAASASSQQASSGAPGPPSAPTQVPVDGGLGWLAAAGAAYAAGRLRRRTNTGPSA